jgi:hypothetical protein
MIIKINLCETCIRFIDGYHHDNFECLPLDNYENISKLYN